MEGKLQENRNGMKLGYTKPDTGEFKEGSSVLLRTYMRSDEDEATRKVPAAPALPHSTRSRRRPRRLGLDGTPAPAAPLRDTPRAAAEMCILRLREPG